MFSSLRWCVFRRGMKNALRKRDFGTRKVEANLAPGKRTNKVPLFGEKGRDKAENLDGPYFF
jgi:hypothetical protein